VKKLEMARLRLLHNHLKGISCDCDVDVCNNIVVVVVVVVFVGMGLDFHQLFS